MTRKLSMFFFLVLFTQVFVLAQQKMILTTDGVLHKIEAANDDARQLSAKELANQPIEHNTSVFSMNKPDGTIDTLRYDKLGTMGTTFGFSPQDCGIQWFVAPCDLTIKAIGFNLSENASATATNAGFEIKIAKVKWTQAQLKAQGDEYIGYYNATGNGYNDITTCPSNPDYTGGWVAKKTGALSPFDSTDFWSDNGTGYPESDYTLGMHWIQTNLLTEPNIKSGEIFGIVFKDKGAITAVRDGLKAGELGYPGWKFYANGRNSIADKGWWSRTYTWDMRAAVVLTGDRPPVIVSYDKLPTTLAITDRVVNATITDDNPSGGAAGVQSAVLKYTIDKWVTSISVAMTAGASNVFTCTIPGQAKGTTVTYRIVATDVNSNATTSGDVTYNVFKQANPTLLVFNGYAAVSGYPQSYYFGHNGASTTGSEVITFPRDRWSYGALSAELVNYYTNIFEICSGGPKKINNDVIKAWLAASPTHNYLLAGDEYLGSISGWVDSTYKAGDFQYDILGISADYNDINYKTTGDDSKASLAAGVAGTLLGDSLHLKVVALAEDSLLINPWYEISVKNWLDGFDPAPGTIIDITAKGIKDTAVGAHHNVGAHHTLAAGNKIVFLSFDPLSLDSPSSAYFWYGFDRVSPLVQALNWFGADPAVGVEDQISGPATYELAQNYPNPFNPSTKLNYSIEKPGFVTLKVYDVLGREVASLVNEVKNAGKNSVSFDASKLASGMYIYTLTSGNFSSTKKMMLLK